MKFVEGNNILCPTQHGFRSNLSCETQLVELVADVSKELDNGKEVDACVLDFSKAFDKVNHAKLIRKLETVGVSKQLTEWTAEFLRDRSQAVTLQGTKSEWCPVTSGVPQGSDVGPSLFLLYINDQPSAVRSKVRLFAGDTIIYTTTDKSDQLQRDLLSLEDWETKWDMKFHPAKCETIRFSRKRSKATTMPYRLHDEEIPLVHSIKYLGVRLQSDLKWHSHITQITAKVSTILGFVRRTIPPQSTVLRARAYKQLVRPVLEYASCAWDLLPKTLSKDVEAVQRRSARTVLNIPQTSHTSTTALLQKLDWKPLAERRERRRTCMFRAMHYGEINTDISNYVSLSDCKHSSRRHGKQYRVERHRTKAHMATFFISTSKIWNDLNRTDRLLCSPG